MADLERQEQLACIERLRANPQDTEALDALERLLRQPTPQRQTMQQAQKLGRNAKAGVKMFLGGPLHGAVIHAWDAWSSHLAGQYQPTSARDWPEHETRDLVAAFVTRFTRIGSFGILVAVVPIVVLAIQTGMMAVQIWQIDVQNRLIRTQNGIVDTQNQLARKQFGETYKTQLSHLLFVEGCKNGQCSAEQLRRNRETMQQQALRGLVEIYQNNKQATPLQNTNLIGLDLSGAKLDRTLFDRADLSKANFSKSSLVGASFASAKLASARFLGAKLDEADLRGADLTRARLDGASLVGATLHGARLNNTTLNGADFSKAKFYPREKLGGRNTVRGVDFSSSSRAMSDVKFKGANLNRATFQERQINKADFGGALLKGAFFNRAEIIATSFAGADLTSADLTGATLNGVTLKGAKLGNATVSGVRWLRVICPDGSKSESNGKTCAGHLKP